MSLTETSKSNGAWFAITSSHEMPKVSVNTLIKSMTEEWETATPFGTPVLPLVKLTYRGSLSLNSRLVSRRASSSTVMPSRKALSVMSSIMIQSASLPIIP